MGASYAKVANFTMSCKVRLYVSLEYHYRLHIRSALSRGRSRGNPKKAVALREPDCNGLHKPTDWLFPTHISVWRNVRKSTITWGIDHFRGVGHRDRGVLVAKR